MESHFDKLYSVWDQVAQRRILWFTAPNDGVAVRQALPALRVPLRDCVLHCHGYCAVNGTPAGLRRCEEVDWSSYKFPETKSEALAPLKLSAEEISSMESEDKESKK